MRARESILIQEKAKQSEPWNSTRGIYADFSNGFDRPKFYCRCPSCNFVHGHYKTPREAIYKRRCAGCSAKDIEKLKKEIRTVDVPEKRKKARPKKLYAESLVSNLLSV